MFEIPEAVGILESIGVLERPRTRLPFVIVYHRWGNFSDVITATLIVQIPVIRFERIFFIAFTFYCIFIVFKSKNM